MSETLETDAAEQELDTTLGDAFADLDAVSPEAVDPTTAPDDEDDFAEDVPETPVVAEGEQPRGPDGKFAPKAAEPETPVVAAPPSAAPPVPFKYRAAGATTEWEGASLDAEGRVVIAPEQVPVLRQKLAAAAQFEADTYPRVQRLEQENATLKSQQTEREAQADALFERFMALANDPDEERALTAFFDFRAKAPSIAAEAQTNYWKQQALKGQTSPSASTAPVSPSVSAPPAREIAQSAVADTFEAIRVEMDPKYRASVSETDWKQIGDRIARYAPAFLRQVTPEEAAASGGQFQPGEYALDTDAVKADIEEQVALFAEKSKASQAAKAAAEAAKFNKGAQTLPKVTPPRQPARAAAPVAPKKDAREEAREREEYKRSFKKSLMTSPGFPDDDDE